MKKCDASVYVGSSFFRFEVLTKFQLYGKSCLESYLSYYLNISEKNFNLWLVFRSGYQCFTGQPKLEEHKTKSCSLFDKSDNALHGNDCMLYVADMSQRCLVS
jgi:hypothetical protein